MKKILFLCGTHGDEGHLINAFDYVDKNIKTYYDVLLVNEKAYEAKVRYINFDMNRNAPGDINSNDYELKRIAEVLEIAKEYDLVIDIHGTNSDCDVFAIITRGSLENISSCIRLCDNIPKVVREGSSDDQGPITQFVKNGFGLEAGPKHDQETIKKLGDVISTLIRKYFNPGVSINALLQKDIYKVVKKVDKSYKFEKDFVEVAIEGKTYYPILTKNNYKDIGAYLCLKQSAREFLHLQS